ncbi:hypothetical protein BDV37DRAFT_275233 [Aspergillus pseudonomiae]|uniref:Uncharacterized protein n=1 Tax=Aspergillus pseudonomiae TaxID=1506151 RepID=A0A5N7CZD4_9EURO|nr:uncharacterized protein BDV37DRAFT_275233 [Aspergillus pseudonomiae]KAE8399530.1 hypothetical protein BDV37DRAFT_275233 [Aspergillus pseudonomiae]
MGFKFLLITKLSFLFAAVIVSGLDTCTAGGDAVQCCASGGFPIPGAPPTKRTSHRGLFTRDAACPTSIQCCEKQCGNGFDPNTDKLDSSTAKFEIVKCNTFPALSTSTEDCLKVSAGPIFDNNNVEQPLTNYHLAIDDGPISGAPGLYDITHNHASWCDQPTASTVECFVPFSYLESQISPPPSDLCHANMNLALNVDISSATCSITGGTLTGTGSFFQYIPITFSCQDTTTCQTQCCCPPPATSKKPCAVGSAYARSSNSLTDLGCGHWGWYFKGVTSGFSADLVLGQTTVIGTVDVTISGNTVSWVYNVGSDYGVIEGHADVICGGAQLQHTTPPKTGDACVPGKFTKNSGCLTPASGSGWSSSYTCSNGGPYSLVFHAKIAKFVDSTSTETCNPIVCPDSSD